MHLQYHSASTGMRDEAWGWDAQAVPGHWVEHVRFLPRCLGIIETAVMSARVEIYIHQHEILHEQAAKQRGGRPSPAHVQINGSVKETIALLPSAPHLSSKWKAAVSPQEKVTLWNAVVLPLRGRILSIPLQSRAPDFVLEEDQILWGFTVVLIKVSSALCVSPKHLRKTSLALESSPSKTPPHPAGTLSLGRRPRHKLSSWRRANYSYYSIYC